MLLARSSCDVGRSSIIGASMSSVASATIGRITQHYSATVFRLYSRVSLRFPYRAPPASHHKTYFLMASATPSSSFVLSTTYFAALLASFPAFPIATPAPAARKHPDVILPVSDGDDSGPLHPEMRQQRRHAPRLIVPPRQHLQHVRHRLRHLRAVAHDLLPRRPRRVHRRRRLRHEQQFSHAALLGGVAERHPRRAN